MGDVTMLMACWYAEVNDFDRWVTILGEASRWWTVPSVENTRIVTCWHQCCWSVYSKWWGCCWRREAIWIDDRIDLANLTLTVIASEYCYVLINHLLSIELLQADVFLRTTRNVQLKLISFSVIIQLSFLCGQLNYSSWIRSSISEIFLADHFSDVKRKHRRNKGIR